MSSWLVGLVGPAETSHGSRPFPPLRGQWARTLWGDLADGQRSRWLAECIMSEFEALRLGHCGEDAFSLSSVGKGHCAKLQQEACSLRALDLARRGVSIVLFLPRPCAGVPQQTAVCDRSGMRRAWVDHTAFFVSSWMGASRLALSEPVEQKPQSSGLHLKAASALPQCVPVALPAMTVQRFRSSSGQRNPNARAG